MARLTANSIFALGLLTTGCAGGDSYVLIGGAEAASTAGVLEVARDEQSTQLSVHLEFLPAPEQRIPELTNYVAWFITPQGKAIRGGALKYDPKERKGHAELDAPAAPFDLLITAEASATPAQPSEYRVIAEKVPAE